MILKLLGLGDLFVALLIIVSPVLSTKIMVLASTYIILKGIFFAINGDFASIADVFVGIYLVFFAFGLSVGLLTILSFGFLLQKAVFSFL
jgi:hypothetical protein